MSAGAAAHLAGATGAAQGRQTGTARARAHATAMTAATGEAATEATTGEAATGATTGAAAPLCALRSCFCLHTACDRRLCMVTCLPCSLPGHFKQGQAHPAAILNPLHATGVMVVVAEAMAAVATGAALRHAMAGVATEAVGAMAGVAAATVAALPRAMAALGERTVHSSALLCATGAAACALSNSCSRLA